MFRFARIVLFVAWLVNFAAAAESPPTLQKIRDSKTLVLGYREVSLPFSYLDAQARPVGYSIDLCQHVVAALKQQLQLPNLQIKYLAVTPVSRFPLLQEGKIDLECGSTSNTRERQQQVAFSLSTYVTAVRIAVRADSGISDLKQLDGRAVVTTTGSIAETLLRKLAKEQHLDIKNYYAGEHSASFWMMASGQVSAFIMDDVLLAGAIANARNPKEFAVVGPPLAVTPYGLVMRKNDAAFKKLVDATLLRLMQSGEMEKLYHKWFMSPIVPKGINLNLPMNEQTRAAFLNPSDQGSTP
jgi:glutamate/aspartate transport system substrate-binding protein